MHTVGGHKHEFVGEVADRFVCRVCTKILHDPHLAVCCGQHFCESCLNEWFRKQRGKQSCPSCGTEGDTFNHVINKGLKSEVNQLKIRCTNRRQGCNWIGELGRLKTHLDSDNGCGFVDVTCPNKCFTGAMTIKRKDLRKHLTHCHLRPYQCEFCGYEDTYEAITGGPFSHAIFSKDTGELAHFGHKATCREVPLTCPNRCGPTRIKRKDMDSHRSKCPQEPVECPFAEAGCKSNLRRCQLQDHLSRGLQQHLLMVMKDYKETKKKLGKAEAKIYENEAKLNETEDNLHKTEDNLHKAEGKLHEAELALKESVVRLSVAEDRVAWSNKLNSDGDSDKIKMFNFSEYRRSGKVWYSPPFYYREGYKMCLAVYANGVEEGAGTHISMSLMLLRGDRDYQLKWPLQCCDASMHGVIAQARTDGCIQYLIGGPHQRLAVNQDQKQLDHHDQLCSLSNIALNMENNCLIIEVFWKKCFLEVLVVIK